jgi:hypothetical protein
VTQLTAGFALVGLMLVPAAFGLATQSAGVVAASGIAALAIAVVLLVRWSLLGPVVLEEGLSGGTALGRSSGLVSRGAGTVVLTLLVASVLGLVLVVPTALVEAFLPAPLEIVLQAAVGAVSLVSTTSLVTTLYFALRSDAEGRD